jgi:hypothetical protein
MCVAEREMFFERGTKETLVLFEGYSLGWYCFSND